MRQRSDRVLRTVMWWDAFLSAAVAIVCFAGSPVVAIVTLPHALVLGICLASVGLAVLLAAFGAVTGVLIMLRMRGGNYLLPADLSLPLPAGMRPDTVRTTA